MGRVGMTALSVQQGAGVKLVRVLIAVGSLISVVAIVAAVWFFAAPPSTIRLAVGRTNSGAYTKAMQELKPILERSGLKVQLVPVKGADKFACLRATGPSAIDAAIIQSGKPDNEGQERVTNLGAIFLEPIWIFGRDLPPGSDIRRLVGKRVAVGTQSIEKHGLANRLLSDNGFSEKDMTLVPMRSSEAAEALLAGKVDAAWITGGVRSDWVKKLLIAPGIELVSFDRAEAYARHHDFLISTRLTRGAIDLGRDVPARDTSLIGPSAQMIVRADLDPALQSLLLDAMQQAFSGGDAVSPPGQYPSKTQIDIPLSEEARRYYASGPSFFRRVLPFWLANFAERTVFFLLPAFTILFPLARSIPPIYDWRIRERISGLYRQLRQLEAKARAAETAEEREEICETLRAMVHRVGQIRIPLSFADDLYRLRAHIRFVLEAIESGSLYRTPTGPVLAKA